MFSAHEGDTTTSLFGSGIYTDKLDKQVADGSTVLPYMAFDKVVISGK